MFPEVSKVTFRSCPLDGFLHGRKKSISTSQRNITSGNPSYLRVSGVSLEEKASVKTHASARGAAGYVITTQEQAKNLFLPPSGLDRALFNSITKILPMKILRVKFEKETCTNSYFMIF